MNNNYTTILNKDITKEVIHIAIIGCGIAGLYTAYRLLSINPNFKIIIYEKDDRIGGRCMTIKWHNRFINLGAGIFTPQHTHLLKLLKDLDIEINTFSSNFECKEIDNYNSYKKNVKEICELFLKVIEENKLQTKNLTFSQFINVYFDKEIHIFCDNYLFFHDIYDRNLYELIDMIRDHTIFYSNQMYKSHSIKNGGWQVLIDKLHNLIKDKVEIQLNTIIHTISYQSNIFLINEGRSNTIPIKFDKVYVCGDIDVRKIKFDNIDVSFLNVISSVPLLRIYGYKEKGGYEKQSYFIPNDRKVIGINNNIQMVCYKDSQLVYDYLYELNKKMGFQNVIRYNIFKQKNEPELDKVLKEEYNTDDTIFKYWEHGVHIRKEYNKYTYPLQQANIYFLGEMMSDVLGFVEGAIKSVDIHFDNSNYYNYH